MKLEDIRIREDLPEYLNKNGLLGIGVELGVEDGIFTAHILKNWKGNRLYSIDSWRHFEHIQDCNNGDHNSQLNAFAQTFMRVYPYGTSSVIIRDLSTLVVDLFAENSLDFVYVDAGHDYDNIVRDLKVWYPKVRKGGLFCGHDYFNGILLIDYGNGVGDPSDIPEDKKVHVYVKQAVDEFIKDKNFFLHVSTEKLAPSWFIQL